MTGTGRRKVFLVHGRNGPAREALESLLRAFDLKVISWRQACTWAGGGSPYTGDVVAAGMQRADAVVVLLTPDDEGRLRPEFRQDRDGPDERELNGQPRMNVVFEAGMAMALDRDRVVIVEVGAVRRMSDIDGVNVVRLDDSIERRRDLAARLQATGLDVDMDDESWRTAGTFAPAAATDPAPRPVAWLVPAPVGGDQGSKPERYLAFWTRFADRAAADPRTAPWLRPKTPRRDNWMTLETRGAGAYIVGFASGRRLRAEYYIDAGSQDINDRVFGDLSALRHSIETAFGGSLSWEDLPGRRASRIAAYRSGEVLTTAEHEDYIEWFLGTISRLRSAIHPLAAPPG